MTRASRLLSDLPRRTRAVTLIWGLALVIATAVAAPASASTTTFCGNSGSPVFLGGPIPADRCAHSVSRQYQYTRNYTAQGYYTGCAIVKHDPGGRGDNTTAPICGPISSYLQSNCTVPYSCVGYPTVTDTYSGYHWGLAAW